MRQWTIDAFAAQPFKGNPACVVEPFDAWPEADWMQSLASENNQAETAYLLRTADPASFGLRWFTPATEVPLCGHATLAAGHAVFAEMGVAAAELTFDTQSGPLGVTRGEGGSYRMDFPTDKPRRTANASGLSAALGVEPKEIWAGRYLIAVLGSEEEVRNLKPDIAALAPIAGAATGGRGNVGVTARAAEGQPYDVVSRFFAPGSGIPEDPATGSLHCCLSPLFSDRMGKATVRFHQAYPGRGGDLVCEHRGDRVWISGTAVTVMESRLRL